MGVELRWESARFACGRQGDRYPQRPFFAPTTHPLTPPPRPCVSAHVHADTSSFPFRVLLMSLLPRLCVDSLSDLFFNHHTRSCNPCDIDSMVGSVESVWRRLLDFIEILPNKHLPVHSCIPVLPVNDVAPRGDYERRRDLGALRARSGGVWRARARWNEVERGG